MCPFGVDQSQSGFFNVIKPDGPSGDLGRMLKSLTD